jgi:hypothetical protein
MARPQVFASELDWTASLDAAQRDGATVVPAALTTEFTDRLHAEIAEGPFEAAESEIGPVRQELASFTLADDLFADVPAHPAVAELRAAFTAAVCSHRAELAEAYAPNEAGMQRYGVGSEGISPHRDGKRHRLLVAVFTTAGRARFAVCHDRTGTRAAEWEVGPTSMSLLQGPGLTGEPDPRVLHTVTGPLDGPRYTVGLRHNARR